MVLYKMTIYKMTQQNITLDFAECHNFAKCYYPKCRYTECRWADDFQGRMDGIFWFQFLPNKLTWKRIWANLMSMSLNFFPYVTDDTNK
jgi:hypothetical protein